MQAQEEALIMIKGKRSKRPRLSLTTAASSSSAAELSGGSFIYDGVLPSPSNSGDLTQSSVEDEEADMANCLILLAKGSIHPAGHTAPPPVLAAAAETYQCKTCSKSFSSFQALGGHRASHKKPNNNKPILAVDDKRQDDFQSNGRDDATIISLQVSNKSRVHECSICRAEFASGQALGGHMRRHRPVPAAAKRPRNILSLDLNLPAPEDDQMEAGKFQFPAKEQVIVFSASPNLVDCHY
ncbi:hypothetical protein CASFOL_027500 [Castilleja foliolosa]|uniref:C2H2-type domain-containing protein n=1 Tax=Castilleja foliolosa TaxID=1961234 RepID=A0ABD3CFZ0_9LAMI